MLVVANLVDLSAIASVGSAVALVTFLLVGAAGYRRRADTGSNAIIVVLAVAVTATVLGFFAMDTLQTAPETFGAIARPTSPRSTRPRLPGRSRLTRVAATIALDAASASFQHAVALARAAGATNDEIVASLEAVTPVTGAARVVRCARSRH